MITPGEIQALAYAEVTTSLAEGDVFIARLNELASADTITTSELPNIQYLQDVTNGSLSYLTSFFGGRPTFDEVDVTLPTAPDPTFSTADDITVPDFTGTAPSLNMPTTPSTALPTAPTAPSISDPVLPTAPTINLPTAPSFASITLPLPPSVDIPSFTATLPSEDFLTPTNNFAWAEEAYTSDLLDELNSKLLDDLQNGGYGIEDDDEAALFERARDREIENALMEVDEARRSAAARGFPLPPGQLTIVEQRAQQNLQNKLSGVSRDIMIKRGDLYVENRRFAIEQAKNIEQIVIGFHSAIQERALNAAKATLDAAIAIYKAQLDRYNARLDAYKSEAQVYEARIRAAISQVEIYKVQMDGARLELESQKAQSDIYNAQLRGIESVVNIYRAQLESANVQASIERTRLDSFRALIDAYQAQIQGKVAEFNMYESQIKGETAKVQAYEVEARAYTAKVEGLKVRSDIALGNLKQETEQARALIDIYRGQLTAAELELKSQVDTIRSQVDLYQADTASFAASSNALGEAMRLEQTQNVSNRELILKAADMQIARVRAELEQLKTLVGTKLDASRIAGQYITALISSNLGSINAISTQST